MSKFKVGDLVVFTERTPNENYQGCIAIVTKIVDKDEFSYKLINQKPGTRNGNAYFRYIDLASKLHQVLN